MVNPGVSAPRVENAVDGLVVDVDGSCVGVRQGLQRNRHILRQTVCFSSVKLDEADWGVVVAQSELHY